MTGGEFVRNRRASFIVLCLTVFGALVSQPSPASAAGGGGGVFTGTITIGAGLGFPLLSPGKTAPFSASFTGVGLSVSSPPAAPVAGPNVNVTASGTMGSSVLGGSFCGSTAGRGSGSIALNGPLGAMNTPTSFEWVQSAGGVVVVTGTAKTTASMVAVLDAVEASPVLQGQSCLSGTVTSFSMVGAAVVTGP